MVFVRIEDLIGMLEVWKYIFDDFWGKCFVGLGIFREVVDEDCVVVGVDKCFFEFNRVVFGCLLVCDV